MIRLILFSYLFFLCSCKKDNDNVPYTLEYPREKLIPLMIDMHVAEAALQQFQTQEKDSMKAVFITQILKIHKLDKKDLEKIMSDLRSDAFLNSMIQEQVMDSVRVFEERIANRAQ
jgi:hypothetical protein